MDNTHFYEVDIDWKSGRRGSMSSPVLDEQIDVVTPPEFPGGEAGVWSPEHLFVASVSSCLMTTFLAIAEHSKLNFTRFSVGARGKMEKGEDGYMISEITLTPKVHLEREKDRDKAERILQKAEKGCLITHSVKTQVSMETQISAEEEETVA